MSGEGVEGPGLDAVQTLPELKLTSPTTARGIWAFVDRVEPGPSARPGAPKLTGRRHDHETYVKSDGVWRVVARKITRLRLDSEAPAVD